MAGPERKHVFDRPENVQRLLRGFYGICALLLVLDVVFHRHVEHVLEKIPGFYALFGFVACVTLVLVAKGLRRMLMRSEDYYDDGLDR